MKLRAGTLDSMNSFKTEPSWLQVLSIKELDFSCGSLLKAPSTFHNPSETLVSVQTGDALWWRHPLFQVSQKQENKRQKMKSLCLWNSCCCSRICMASWFRDLWRKPLSPWLLPSELPGASHCRNYHSSGCPGAGRWNTLAPRGTCRHDLGTDLKVKVILLWMVTWS